MTFFNLGLLKITGDKAAIFLQGQVTCDVQQLQEKKTSFCGRLNLQGRVTACFHLIQQENVFFALMNRDLIPFFLSDLNRYAPLSRVKLDDVSDQWDYLGIHLPNPTIEQNPENGFIPWGKDRYCLITPLTKKTKAEKFCVISENEWHCLDLQAGISRITLQTIGKFLPQELNYATLNALSLTKGCYFGQEIVARLEHRGHLKRHLKYITLDLSDIVSPGDSLWTTNVEQPIADIVDVAIDPSRQKQCCLIVLQDAHQTTLQFQTKHGISL